jgi:hypothetical protein
MRNLSSLLILCGVLVVSACSSSEPTTMVEPEPISDKL